MSSCAACKTFFDCKALEPNANCWCLAKPVIAVQKSHACLCESCFDLSRKHGPLRSFRLNIAYMGTHFCGFQQQDNGRTVEGELKTALQKISQQIPKLSTAGRTDAGVHASGQAVSAQFFSKLTPRQLTLALRSLLPEDMSVFRIDEMPLGFDARHHSIGKQYLYRIAQGLTKNPFLAATSLHIADELFVASMNQAAQFFVGEHDFASFRGSQCSAQHARRFIWHCQVSKADNMITIDIRGNAFCFNMVRIMVGTLIEVGRGRRAAASISDALKANDRTAAGVTAKAHGLTLARIYYPDALKDAHIPHDARFPRYPVSSSTWGFNDSEIVYGPM